MDGRRRAYKRGRHGHSSGVAAEDWPHGRRRRVFRFPESGTSCRSHCVLRISLIETSATSVTRHFDAAPGLHPDGPFQAEGGQLFQLFPAEFRVGLGDGQERSEPDLGSGGQHSVGERLTGSVEPVRCQYCARGRAPRSDAVERPWSVSRVPSAPVAPVAGRDAEGCQALTLPLRQPLPDDVLPLPLRPPPHGSCARTSAFGHDTPMCRSQ